MKGFIQNLFPISFLFLPLFLSSCVTPKKPALDLKAYERGYNDSVANLWPTLTECQQNAKTLEYNFDQLEKENALKTEMLKRFNLVNEKGYLRSKTQTAPKPPKGNESWIK